MFENWNRNDDATCSRIIMAYKTLPATSQDEFLDYILNPIFFGNMPIGFFDGVADKGIGGVGIVLKFSIHHYFKIHLAVGLGTSTKAKLQGLWSLLFFAKGCHIQDLTVAGDSQVIIDWLNGKSQLEALNLRVWKEKIQALKSHFRCLQGFHVHRQFNNMADSLSKLALKEQPGWLHFEEIYKNSQINRGQIFIF
jgi:ribonuclease HI